MGGNSRQKTLVQIRSIIKGCTTSCILKLAIEASVMTKTKPKSMGELGYNTQEKVMKSKKISPKQSCSDRVKLSLKAMSRMFRFNGLSSSISKTYMQILLDTVAA